MGKLGPLKANVARYPTVSVPVWIHELEARSLPTVLAVLRSGRGSLHWISAHTGLPVIVVAALAVVVGWRVARRTWHIAFELVLAVAALLVATHLGWIRW